MSLSPNEESLHGRIEFLELEFLQLRDDWIAEATLADALADIVIQGADVLAEVLGTACIERVMARYWEMRER